MCVFAAVDSVIFTISGRTRGNNVRAKAELVWATKYMCPGME
jgi:hypothetical protein